VKKREREREREKAKKNIIYWHLFFDLKEEKIK
jgi:hypothetical protein